MTQTSPLLFNASIASFSISSLFEIGFFDELSQTPSGVALGPFCEKKGLDRDRLMSLIFSTKCFEVLSYDDQTDVVKGDEQFDDVFANKGYFHWMLKGYGDFLTNMTPHLEKDKHEDLMALRDGGAIARSGKDYGKMYVDALVEDLLSSIEFEKIADLGCGSANRIIEIVKQKGCRALGVEINTKGVGVARENVLKADLGEQIDIHQGDVSNLVQVPEFEDVDLISSFFMGHDLWPKERCVEIFKRFKEVFPKLEYFLFCDTFRSGEEARKDIPTFTLGFEVFHQLMGQYIPTREEWHELFGESGWTCEKEIATGIPYTNIFLLRPC